MEVLLIVLLLALPTICYLYYDETKELIKMNKECEIDYMKLLEKSEKYKEYYEKVLISQEKIIEDFRDNIKEAYIERHGAIDGYTEYEVSFTKSKFFIRKDSMGTPHTFQYLVSILSNETKKEIFDLVELEYNSREDFKRNLERFK